MLNAGKTAMNWDEYPIVRIHFSANYCVGCNAEFYVGCKKVDCGTWSSYFEFMNKFYWNK